jgi:predicted phage-related endonuclease
MEKKEMKPQVRAKSPESRRCFIGGSDARTIMGSDDGLIGL